VGVLPPVEGTVVVVVVVGMLFALFKNERLVIRMRRRKGQLPPMQQQPRPLPR